MLNFIIASFARNYAGQECAHCKRILKATDRIVRTPDGIMHAGCAKARRVSGGKVVPR